MKYCLSDEAEFLESLELCARKRKKEGGNTAKKQTSFTHNGYDEVIRGNTKL
jgi:hypothetical protein